MIFGLRVGIIAVVFGLIGWLSLSERPFPRSVMRNFPPPYDHVALYAGITLALLTVWPQKIWWIAGGLVLAGAGMELAQIALPYRGFEWGDIFGNLAGVIAGLVLFNLGRLVLSYLR